MNWMDIYHSMGGVLEQLTIDEVLKSNQESKKYGLELTTVEAQELIEARNRAIRGHGRIELGIEVVKKIIAAFCTSFYINSTDYASTVNELVETFYFMKNETEDRIGDDELISMMKEFFDGSCRGSLELLKNRELALFAQKLRQDMQKADNSPEDDSDEIYRY